MSRKNVAQTEVDVVMDDVTVDSDATIESTETDSAVTKQQSKKQYKVKRQLDPHTIVSVRSGFHGLLIYKSKHTGETFEWADFGDEQDMELQELRSAKASTDKVFYENNWFIIDDPEIVEFLGVAKYYQNSLKIDEFDTLFEMSPEEVSAKVAKLPKGQRMSVAYRARKMIENGDIDSIKLINALENSLGVELIER